MINQNKINYAAILLAILGNTYAAEETYSWSAPLTQSPQENAQYLAEQVNDNKIRGAQLTFTNLSYKYINFTELFKEGKLALVSLKFKNCDLSGTVFSGLCLHGIVFKGCNLEEANLANTDLSDFYDLWALKYEEGEKITFISSITSFKYSNVKNLNMMDAKVDRKVFNRANHTETLSFRYIRVVQNKSYYK